MRRLRIIVALVWLAAATAAQASSVSNPVGQRARERPPQALLSDHPACGTANAARTRPSFSPVQDAQGLAFLAIPLFPRPSAETVTAESGVDVARQISALPHPQRGPPLAA